MASGLSVQNIDEIKSRLLQLLSTEKGLTFGEIANLLSWSGDRRPLRKALAELVREGKVRRVPDYTRKRMVFVKV